MELSTILIVALLVTKVLLLGVIYLLWRSNSRLKEANRMIFMMKRKGLINEKQLEELRKANREGIAS
jgi:hypothetical protein